MVIFYELNCFRHSTNLEKFGGISGPKCQTFQGIPTWWSKEILVIFWRVNDNIFFFNIDDSINIKPERYLVWRFDIHEYSTKVSVQNVFTVKVVTNRRDLRQKRHYVLLLTLSSKNVIFESAIRTVGTRDLTNRWSRFMIFRWWLGEIRKKIRVILGFSENWLGFFSVHAHNFSGGL